MELDPGAQIVADRSVDPRGLPLTPDEFFVLTRLDTPVRVSDLLKATGLGDAASRAALAKLVGLGAVKVLPAAPSRPTVPVPDRRRAQLVAQLAAARSAPVPAAAQAPAPAAAAGSSSGASAPAGATETSAADDPPPPWPRTAVDDPRIVADGPVPVEEQQRILALVDRLDDLSPYEILGIWPTHDGKAIRRAYHEVSRDFHPDSYYGQEIGELATHLAALFRRATQAHEALRAADVRAPYVDAEIARRAERARRAALIDESERRRLELAAAQIEAEAALRRVQRAQRRAARQRDALDHAMRRQLDAYVADALAAEQSGNLARAANSWRLALQLVPQDATLRDNWQRCLETARGKRAADAFARAMQLRDLGQRDEAVPLLVEAATAHPTVDYLAHAAEAVAPRDAARGRQFALGALETLRAEAVAGGGSGRRPADLSRLHLMLARAFLAAGQHHTAREQAMSADRLRPGDPEVRALLNAIKLP